MANYETLKAAIQAVIKTNGNQTITGAVMQSALISMINGLGANMQFAGIAIPSTSPGTPDGPTFYLAFQNGTYFNFDRTSVYEKPRVFMWGRPGGPEGAWESVELSVPTTAKYNTDRQLEQNRVNKLLAAKANSEDVDNEFAEVRSDLSQKSSVYSAALVTDGYFRTSLPAILLPNQPASTLLCFYYKPPTTGTQHILYSEDIGAIVNYVVSQKALTVRMRGTEVVRTSVPEYGGLFIIGISYDHGAQKCVAMINSKISETSSFSQAYNPRQISLGATTVTGSDAKPKAMALLYYVRMNFPVGRSFLESGISPLNTGIPEKYRVPTSWHGGSDKVVCELIPEYLSKGNAWMDASGDGNNMTFYEREGGKSADMSLSMEYMGFPDTIIGTEAPAVIPNFIGQRYVDTTNKAAYTAYGTSSASDWK